DFNSSSNSASDSLISIFRTPDIGFTYLITPSLSVALFYPNDISPNGAVVALDGQPAMLEEVKKRMAAKQLTNVRTLLSRIDRDELERDSFDRALLVAVLGEIPDREAALRHIFAALKSGGLLSITEVIPDPHYQPKSLVCHLAEAAGFQFDSQYGNWLAFTLNFKKPDKSAIQN
nr:class I SAM-dependent methyltransferase [Cyanosarcina radialis HA8281-LM2]